MKGPGCATSLQPPLFPVLRPRLGPLSHCSTTSQNSTRSSLPRSKYMSMWRGGCFNFISSKDLKIQSQYSYMISMKTLSSIILKTNSINKYDIYTLSVITSKHFLQIYRNGSDIQYLHFVVQITYIIRLFHLYYFGLYFVLNVRWSDPYQ